jgi:hypothetical protein
MNFHKGNKQAFPIDIFIGKSIDQQGNKQAFPIDINPFDDCISNVFGL